MNFKELQTEIRNRGVAHKACSEGIGAVNDSKDKIDLLKAILMFWNWCFEGEKIIDEEFILDNFSADEIKESGLYLPSEKVAYAEYVKTLKLPTDGWNKIMIAGKTVIMTRTNHKDSDLAKINPKNCEHYFTQENALATVKKCGCRLFTNEEHISLSLYISVWDYERRGRWFKCPTPEGGFVDVFFPASGRRIQTSGAFSAMGTNGYYWSSTITRANGYSMGFGSTDVYPMSGNSRAHGFGVRLVRDL